MPLKKRLKLDKDPVFLIDGTSYFYRGFYAYQDLKRSDGFPTNAIFIVLRLLLRLLKEEQPKHVVFVMDGKGPTFRNEIYSEYKANRSPMPEALVQQVEPMRNAVELMGIKLIVSDGVEADDCIASLADKFKKELPVVIVGSDKDLNQCLDDNVFIWDPVAKKEKLMGSREFAESSEVSPEQWADFQALTGDSADNIPGIPGVGPKTALKILKDMPTLEDVREGYGQLPDKLKNKVEEHLEDIFLYRKLTRMDLDCCRNWELPELEVQPLNPEFIEFLRKNEFRSLLRQMPESGGQETTKPAGKSAQKANAGGEVPLLLFGSEQEAREKAGKLEVKTANALSDMPDMTGLDVGFVFDGRTFFLGVDGQELKFTGSPSELAKALSAANVVATPSLQELLRKDEAWQEIALEKWFDLSLAAYLLNPEERNYSWPRLRDSLFQDAQAEDVHPDAQGLAALAYMKNITPRLENAHLLGLMNKLEIPLIPVLVDMERQGVAIDKQSFSSFLDEVNSQIGELTRTIISQAGETFNIRSSQQLAVVLFETLGLKPAGKTPGGALSTSSQVLEKIRDKHPIVENILEYRTLEKLRSTYLEPLPRLAAKDGRLHTNFNQLATATGRLSSSNPNLQNIPIRGPQGKRMRACFTAGKGKSLVAADYSQIELRVLAHFSKDPALVQAFEQDADIHARTAALLYDKEALEVSGEERSNAKTINFGLIYGMGPQKLARELKITLNQAKEFIERYFEKLETLKGFYDGLVADAEKQGFVTTIEGRRRLLPELASRNQQQSSQARRQAINTVIQGSAADIIKLAMLEVHKDEELKKLSARLILQVHDELVLEVPDQNASQAGQRLKEIMQSVSGLDIPLKVDLGIGRNWAQAH